MTKDFSLTYQASGLVSGFLGFFSMLRFQLIFLKITSLDRTFQDPSNGLLYFFVAQVFVDFLICIYRGIMKKVSI